MLSRSWEQVGRAYPPVLTVPDHLGAEHLLVTGHALVRQVLTDPVGYRPDNALDAFTPIPVAALRVLVGHGFKLPPTLANNAGPSHPGIRAVVADALHPSRVADARPWLTKLVRQRVARLDATLATGQPVDLYADLVADLPLLVLARLTGLPQLAPGPVKRFARAALDLFWAPLDPHRQRLLAAEVGGFHRMLRDVATNGAGLAGRLRAAGHDSEVVAAALFFLLVAGQETTSQFLTLLLHRLHGTPEVLHGLAEGTVAVTDVVEEGLRLEPPIVTWRRVAAADTTLGGVPVRRGTSVVLWLARAGRDATVVADPDEFRPGQRGSRRHLAFGAGVHRCVGDQLARMEAAVVVAEAARLLPEVTVLRAPRYPDNLSFRMPDAFVVVRPDTGGSAAGGPDGQLTSSAQTRQSSSTP